MSGEVVHFEIPSDNVERACKFYSKTFGWKMEPMPGIDYTLVRTTASTADGRPALAGSINGGLLLRQALVRAPSVTIHVDSIDRVVKSVEKHGGKLLEPKAPIGDGSIGFAAYFRDPEGNVIGLFERASG
jgi:uncharacterized protein